MKWSIYAPRVNSGAPAADFADRAGRSLDIGIILAPNPDLVAGTGTPTGVDDALGRVLGRRVLMRTSFGHAVTLCGTIPYCISSVTTDAGARPIGGKIAGGLHDRGEREGAHLDSCRLSADDHVDADHLDGAAAELPKDAPGD